MSTDLEPTPNPKSKPSIIHYFSRKLEYSRQLIIYQSQVRDYIKSLLIKKFKPSYLIVISQTNTSMCTIHFFHINDYH